MNRIKDYIGFAIWLLGIGYIVFWPFTSSDNGVPFAASLICQFPWLALLCHLPHPLTLPPGLQLIGLLSAGWVCLRLATRAIVRLWRARVHRASAASALNARIPAALLRPSLRKPISPLRQVKPRSRFGLRGTPR
jgi:hypothetical protein